MTTEVTNAESVPVKEESIVQEAVAAVNEPTDIQKKIIRQIEVISNLLISSLVSF